jgi:hypothetical protein
MSGSHALESVRLKPRCVRRRYIPAYISKLLLNACNTVPVELSSTGLTPRPRLDKDADASFQARQVNHCGTRKR